jgi:hypothetical protein
VAVAAELRAADANEVGLVKDNDKIDDAASTSVLTPTVSTRGLNIARCSCKQCDESDNVPCRGLSGGSSKPIRGLYPCDLTVAPFSSRPALFGCTSQNSESLSSDAKGIVPLLSLSLTVVSHGCILCKPTKSRWRSPQPEESNIMQPVGSGTQQSRT